MCIVGYIGKGEDMNQPIREQLHFLESLVETDQKTVEAVASRLALIRGVIRNIAEKIEKELSETEGHKLTNGQ